MKPLHQLLYFLLAVYLSGCNFLSSESDKEINLKVEPLQKIYILDNETDITVRVKNVSSRTIYSSTCNYGLVEELDNSKVSNAIVYENACECICTFSLKPNEEKKLNVRGIHLLNHDEFLFTHSVTYRINPYFYSDKELHDNISPDTYESTPILLTKK